VKLFTDGHTASKSYPPKGKGKVHHTSLDSVGGCSPPSPRPWARRWRTTNERCTRLGINRRLHADLILCYKIIHAYVSLVIITR